MTTVPSRKYRGKTSYKLSLQTQLPAGQQNEAPGSFPFRSWLLRLRGIVNESPERHRERERGGERVNRHGTASFAERRDLTLL